MFHPELNHRSLEYAGIPASLHKFFSAPIPLQVEENEGYLVELRINGGKLHIFDNGRN